MLKKKILLTVKNCYGDINYQKEIETELSERDLQNSIDDVKDNFDEGYNWQDYDIWEELEEKGLIKGIGACMDEEYEVIL